MKEKVDKVGQGMAMWFGVFKETLEKRIEYLNGALTEDDIGSLVRVADAAEKAVLDKVELWNTRIDLGVK